LQTNALQYFDLGYYSPFCRKSGGNGLEPPRVPSAANQRHRKSSLVNGPQGSFVIQASAARPYCTQHFCFSILVNMPQIEMKFVKAACLQGSLSLPTFETENIESIGMVDLFCGDLSTPCRRAIHHPNATCQSFSDQQCTKVNPC